MTQAKQLRCRERLLDLPAVRTATRYLGRAAGLSDWLPRSSEEVPGWAVLSAGLVPVALTVAWLVADSVQPRTYSPIRDTVSVLAGLNGTDRWIMTWGLFLVCGFYLITAVGLAGVAMPARILLIVAGVCSAGIATSPEPPSGPTATHLAWVALGGVTIAIWPAVAGWRMQDRPLVLSVWSSAVVTLMFFALLAWVVLQTRGGKDLGLAERLDSGVQTCWPFVVALVLRHAARDRRPDTALADPRDEVPVDGVGDDDWPSDTTCRC
jgi:hypothetical membrane protein